MSIPTPNRDLLNLVGVTIRDRIKKRIRDGKIKPASKNASKRTLVGKTKQLINSINFQLNQDRISIGSNLAYAHIQHEGGTIVPRKAKFLTIPLTDAARVHSARDFENTFIRNGIIFMVREGDTPLALYKLQKSVTIPPRPFLFIDRTDQDIIKDRIAEWWRKQK